MNTWKPTTQDEITHCARCGQDMVAWTKTPDGPVCVQCVSAAVNAQEEEQIRWLRLVVLSTGAVTLLGIAALVLLW